MMDLECTNKTSSQHTGLITPLYHVSFAVSTEPSFAPESLTNEVSRPTNGIINHQSSGTPPPSHQLGRAGPSDSLDGSSFLVASYPNPPSQEDAIRAANTLLSFIQNAGVAVDQNEYYAVVRITEKLTLRHHGGMGLGDL
jgi:hypothetical protein